MTPEEFVKLAREIPRNERVPYAFEKRILARLGSAAPDALSLWTNALWRAVAPCLGIMAIAAAVSFARVDESVAAQQEIDLDSAVLAPPEAVFDLNA